MAEFVHIPVLKSEVVSLLCVKPNGIYVDGTIGGAGHAKAILESEKIKRCCEKEKQIIKLYN